MSRTPRRRGATLACSAALAAGLICSAPSSTAVAATSPNYRVSVTSIKALDETGPDVLGSDEVYGGFQLNDPLTGGHLGAFRSQLLLDVDTGDTKVLDGTRNCMPAGQIVEFVSGRSFFDARDGDRWLCRNVVTGKPTGLTGPFTLTATLWESEPCRSSPDCDAGRDRVAGPYKKFDQSLGVRQITFSAPGLAQDLPFVTAQRDYVLDHRGSGARYLTTITVVRVG